MRYSNKVILDITNHWNKEKNIILGCLKSKQEEFRVPVDTEILA